MNKPAKLSDKQLLLLDCFMYTDLAKQYENRTVEAVLMDFMEDDGVTISKEKVEAMFNEMGGGQLSGDLSGKPIDRVVDIFQQMADDPVIPRLEIAYVDDKGEGFIRAAVFEDTAVENREMRKDGATLAFRGTGGSFWQWDNNLEGYGDIIQPTQEEACELGKELKRRGYTDLSVTGHSNGQNAGMYFTVMFGDIVERCFGFEGQGVSKECMNDPEFKANLEKYGHKITNICGSTDFVNILLYPIAQTTKYINSDDYLVDGYLSHGTYGLLSYANKNNSFDKDGNFRETAFVNQAPYLEKLHEATIWLADKSDVPIVGPALEFFTDVLGIGIGIGFDKKHFFNENTNLFNWRSNDHWISAINIFKESCKTFKRDIKDDALWLKDVVKDKVLQVYDFLDDFATTLIEKTKHALRDNVNPGYVYGKSYPQIVVDTDGLTGYADRIDKVNSRIANVDKQLNGLYLKVNLWDIGKIIDADILTGYSLRLAACSKYLRDTAADFEKVEKDIANLI